MDLNEAIRKHARWKTWFQQAVSAGEPLDVAILAKDNQCDLGKWLYGEAQSLYGMRPSHALCLTRHAAIHVEAARIAAVYPKTRFRSLIELNLAMATGPPDEPDRTRISNDCSNSCPRPLETMFFPCR